MLVSGFVMAVRSLSPRAQKAAERNLAGPAMETGEMKAVPPG